MVDLTVDKKKTFAWATCPLLRSRLRADGLKVLHHARELGGHLAFPANIPIALSHNA